MYVCTCARRREEGEREREGKGARGREGERDSGRESGVDREGLVGEKKRGTRDAISPSFAIRYTCRNGHIIAMVQARTKRHSRSRRCSLPVDMSRADVKSSHQRRADQLKSKNTPHAATTRTCACGVSIYE